MSDTAPQDLLIARLARDLRPVQRLAPPWQRAGLWLLASLWIGLLLALFADFAALRLRLFASPDMWISQAGAMLTALLACFAAMQSSIPGRSPRWAWLPVPSFLIWIGASTGGCLRLVPIAGAVREPAMHPMVCFAFLLLVSLPLSLVLVLLLRRACPLRPGLTALLAGLACAAAAASLIALIHPYDATADDLLVHLGAVGVIVGASRVVAPRYLRKKALLF